MTERVRSVSDFRELLAGGKKQMGWAEDGSRMARLSKALLGCDRSACYSGRISTVFDEALGCETGVK